MNVYTENELLSILPKSTDAEIYLSNMDHIFMILTLFKLGPEFDNIREQILIGFAILTFDEIFARLLRHSSTATQTRRSKVPLDTSVMLSHSHPRGDSWSVHGGNRGRGHRPYCTYCNRVGHIQDRCYQLCGCPLCSSHVAQFSESPPPEVQPSSHTPLPQRVTLTPGEYEEYLRLTQVAKSASIAFVALTGNVFAYLTHSLGHGLSIPVHLIIFLVIRISSLLLLSLHLYLYYFG